jgi:TM2 domain-containing membrane protein YozV
LIISSYCFSQSNYFSAEKRKLFADYLYTQNDYLRAFDEYRFYLQYNDNDTIKLRLAQMLIAMERYSEAEDYLKMLFLGSSNSEEAKLNYYLIKYKTLTPLEFRIFSKEKLYYPEKYDNNVKKLEQITYFYQKGSRPDSTIMFQTFKSDTLALNKVREFYYRKYFPQNKNPNLAAGLSAIVPGLGKIYTEQYSDGITAFIINGLCAYLAYDNFNAKHYTRGWIFTGLGALFYGGNIYGSMASAHIFNAKLSFDLNNEIQKFFSDNNFFIPIF